MRTHKHLPLSPFKQISTLFLTCFLLFHGTIGRSAEEPLLEACSTQCVTPYGELLGRSSGDVPAYSNCSSQCVSQDPNQINDTYTGMEWQCVEYARRWLFRTEGLVFESVDVAADIWDGITYLVDTSSNDKRNLRNLPNGSAESPRRGDLLIWSSEFLGTGHIAVVARVDHEQGFVEVVEQNFLNQKWPGKYARRIPMQQRQGGVWLDDELLVGWKRLVD
ncbi:MAG: CHAP domain-containing protein [Gammaproteobacteria bacterium]